MKAIVKKIETKECTKTNGDKFNKVNIEFDVQIKGSFSEEFIKNYFNQAGVKAKDVIGAEVDVSLKPDTFKDKDGNEVNFIKVDYMSLLKGGKKIKYDKDALPF